MCLLCAVHVILCFNLQIDLINFLSFNRAIQWIEFKVFSVDYINITITNGNSKNCDFSEFSFFFCSFFLLFLPWVKSVHSPWTCASPMDWTHYAHTQSSRIIFFSLALSTIFFIPFKFKFNLIFDAFTHITSSLETAAEEKRKRKKITIHQIKSSHFCWNWSPNKCQLKSEQKQSNESERFNQLLYIPFVAWGKF